MQRDCPLAMIGTPCERLEVMMNDNDSIGVFELPPEAAALLRHQYDLDRAGAGPKAPVGKFKYQGVWIESRWAVLSEFNTMQEIIDAMPELLARRLDSFWCDSKAEACYDVTVKDGLWIDELRWAIEDAVIEVGGGHNGILINASQGNGGHLDPNWGEP